MSDKEGNGSDDSPYASPAQRTAYENGRDEWGDDCRCCGQRGHWQSECPERWGGNNMRCIESGSAEHANNCPIYLEHQRRREREEAARADMGDVERNVDHEEEEEDNEINEDGSGVDDKEN